MRGLKSVLFLIFSISYSVRFNERTLRGLDLLVKTALNQIDINDAQRMVVVEGYPLWVLSALQAGMDEIIDGSNFFLEVQEDVERMPFVADGHIWYKAVNRHAPGWVFDALKDSNVGQNLYTAPIDQAASQGNFEAVMHFRSQGQRINPDYLDALVKLAIAKNDIDHLLMLTEFGADKDKVISMAEEAQNQYVVKELRKLLGGKRGFGDDEQGSKQKRGRGYDSDMEE